jgi:hypothetical protein
METNESKRLRKYSAISIGVVLVMAFVLVQPTMQTSYAVSEEAVPAFDDCDFDGINGGEGDQPDDAIGMTTIRNKDIVKTTHVEKEKFECRLAQGDLQVFVDVDTYIDVYENITSHKVLKASALVTTCLKDEGGAKTIACEFYTPPTTPVPVGSDCDEVSTSQDEAAKNPQEINTVNKGNIVKTIVAQKEIFKCNLDEDATIKKVDVVTFTEQFEDLKTMTVTDVQFHEMRCVVLITNDNDNSDPEDDVRDATVESCIFSTVPT